MPKVKTNSAAKKRFQFTASGKIKRKKAFKNHILTKKGKKRKRHLSDFAVVDKTQEHIIKAMLVK